MQRFLAEVYAKKLENKMTRAQQEKGYAKMYGNLLLKRIEMGQKIPKLTESSTPRTELLGPPAELMKTPQDCESSFQKIPSSPPCPTPESGESLLKMQVSLYSRITNCVKVSFKKMPALQAHLLREDL